MNETQKLAKLPGPVDEDWRLTHAAAAEADVRAIVRWLDETAVLLELFAGDTQMERALGSTAALCRERRNGLCDEARRLRAAIQDGPR